MAALSRATLATREATTIYIDAPLAATISSYPWIYILDNEVISIHGGGTTTILSVDRGVWGSTPAVHAIGTTVASLLTWAP